MADHPISAKSFQMDSTGSRGASDVAAAGFNPSRSDQPAPLVSNETGPVTNRRCLLQAAAAAMALLPVRAHAEEDDPRTMLRPQVGDVLVRSGNDKVGPVVEAAEIKIGDPPVFAWAMDPVHNVVRDGSRLNQVLLLRLDPSTLGPQTAPHAADGLVAYSAICTHAQCTVTGWLSDKQVLHCPCHQSEYDPRHDATVVAGPAPRALAALPIEVTDGKPKVAGLFIGRIGMDRQTM